MLVKAAAAWALQGVANVQREMPGMTIRNLERLLAPRSIVLTGASDRPNSVGTVLTKNHHTFSGVASSVAKNKQWMSFPSLPPS